MNKITLFFIHTVLLCDGAFPVFQANVSRPAETTIISVGRVKHTHLYHDCTKWFKLDLIKKKNQHLFWVMKTLLNFHDLEICVLQNFWRASLYLQNTMLTSPLRLPLPILLLSLGQRCPMRKNQRSVAQTERKTSKEKSRLDFVNMYAHLSLLENKYASLMNPSPSLSWNECVDIRATYILAGCDYKSWC